MVTIDEVDELIADLRELRRDLLRMQEAEKRVGDDITVSHPVTGGEVSIGKVKRSDIEPLKQAAESKRQSAMGRMDSIDLDRVESVSEDIGVAPERQR